MILNQSPFRLFVTNFIFCPVNAALVIYCSFPSLPSLWSFRKSWCGFSRFRGGWPQCPGWQPTVTLPIWPPKSPPHLIGQITRCSQTPVAAWHRPSEESDNVCKLLMLCLVSVSELFQQLRTHGLEGLEKNEDQYWVETRFSHLMFRF